MRLEFVFFWIKSCYDRMKKQTTCSIKVRGWKMLAMSYELLLQSVKLLTYASSDHNSKNLCKIDRNTTKVMQIIQLPVAISKQGSGQIIYSIILEHQFINKSFPNHRCSHSECTSGEWGLTIRLILRHVVKDNMMMVLKYRRKGPTKNAKDIKPTDITIQPSSLLKG